MFNHPGKAFIRSHGAVQELADVLAYVDFLRAEAGVPAEKPVDLGEIYRCFGIPTPKQAPLPNQQGLLLNPDAGLIILNENDIAARQRFTAAHELVELLFDALPQGNGWARQQRGPFNHPTKEMLCDRGAAQLLMPAGAIQRIGKVRGINFQTAQDLAARYEVSTTAALVQLVRCSPAAHSLVMWRWMNKKSEKRSRRQISMFDPGPTAQPAKKLRVLWAIGSDTSPHIPKNKSLPQRTAIFAAFQSGRFSASEEFLDLGSISGRFKTENWPFHDGQEWRVLSLFEYLD